LGRKMGLRWYKHVWADIRLGEKAASYRLTMLALAEYADDATGQCWPGIALLSDMTGLSERQVQRVLRDLETDGFIAIEQVHGRAKNNTYTIIGCKQKGDTGVVIGDTDVTYNGYKKVTPMSPIAAEKVTSSAEKVTPMSPDPIDPLLIQDDHLPGKFLRALIEGAGFAYFDKNFMETACRLESDYSQEQLVRAVEATKDAHRKKIGNGERGITSPLAYMKTILVDGSNGSSSNSYVAPKPAPKILTFKAWMLRTYNADNPTFISVPKSELDK